MTTAAAATCVLLWCLSAALGLAPVSQPRAPRTADAAAGRPATPSPRARRRRPERVRLVWAERLLWLGCLALFTWPLWLLLGWALL